MLNKDGQRALAYVARVNKIVPIEGRDRVECAYIGGWTVMVQKGQFAENDLGIFFEPDSKLPEKEPYMFLAKRHFKIRIEKFKTPSGHFYSQGLLMTAESLGGKIITHDDGGIQVELNGLAFNEGDDLTELLGVTYAVQEDNIRKAKEDPNAKYKSMMSRHPKLAKSKFGRWCMKRDWAKRILYVFLGKKKLDGSKSWPVGKFPGVSKTDQERCENMTWVLNEKEPFIKTEKCDGSSGTFILERVKHKFKKPTYEFYVCSRNVRMLSPNQECYYEKNYYWDIAKSYHIEDKMKDWLNANDADWVCWQGEICGPGIQGNPHHLKDLHFYGFHWTDSISGRLSIIEAENRWHDYGMQSVPIVDTEYIMPDDFEEFKKSADGFYDSDVCEGHVDCPREGYVYYKVSDPTFSFKNVSRQYLLNR